MAFPDQTQTTLVESLPKGSFRITSFNAPVPMFTMVVTNANRPAANLYPQGFMIWNSDDKAPNFSGGTANTWYDAMGFLT